MKKSISVFLFIFLFIFPAAASDWQDSDKSQLQNEFLAFMEGVKAKDIQKAQDALPPAFWQYIADKSKQDIPALKESMATAMKASVANVKTLEGSYKTEDIKYRQTSDGEKYAIIPYKTHIVLNSGQELNTDSKVLIILVDGKYYFLDIGKEMYVNIIKEIYPQYKDIDVSVN